MCFKIVFFIKKSARQNRLFLLNLLLFSIFSFSTFAQISISFPTNRIVFQRNNENFGFINIIGNYTQAIDKIEARLTPVLVGQGTATDWILVQENLKAGYFTGKIKAQGGWYKLEVRAVKDNSTLQTLAIEKVGIGEVFIALGQSNAQGLPESGAKGASDDRVNTVNYFNDNGAVPENLNFVQLSQNVDIAPHGSTPWCYGELGDKLAKRLNVPVMFFNAGFLLVSVINWRESAEGLPTFNFVLDVGGRFQYNFGIPYSNLKNTLNYYSSLLGVRSLLWIQGETDNSPNRLSADVYAANLQKVIDISRNDFDENLTWTVARTSLTYLSLSNTEIIGGQNRVINKAGNNVFAGPLTDILQVPRPDNVHFKNVPPNNMGLTLLAENWDKFLDDNFFKNSKPVLAKSIIEPEVSCDANNQVNLKLPAGLNYNWSNAAKTNQITVNKGVFSVALKDPKGNKLLAPTMNTNLVFPTEKPSISSDNSLEFCSDGTTKIELTANGLGLKSFVWSSGETTKKISVGSTSEFTVIGRNELGCAAVISDKSFVKVNPNPAQPKVVVSPANNTCEGQQNITLSIESNDKILWSNDATTKAIILDKAGNYEFSTKVTNEFGCVSPSAISPKLSIFPTPKQPTITQVGLFSLNALNGDFLANDLLEWKKENTVFSKTNATNLKVLQAGNYQVSTIRTYKTADNQDFNCQSKISTTLSILTTDNFLTLYPNPASDLFYIETKETIKNLEVKFFTISGKLVYKFRLDDTSERREIDVRSLEKGTYVVRIKGDNFEEATRMIIQSK